ncbi:hypothetical protein PHLGIDRAFT_17937 [Phlebiopsis gigantea 11061_1 CR5-6]|uniref:Uncharacterized protein n=1 Tax=Phlebiopsis gigantea (strain 11061_1 CR5-6) TaxID=745531 RepID=A0A0C3S5Z4_PHLG1|nr:hypothetical protein PHLGIDRAFT_17937 [Phlebiopsis gigantea 11061_1 CR5-6]
MSYVIRVIVINKNCVEHKLVEKSVWMYANGGTWEQYGEVHKLTMGGSGTSGMLRFLSPSGEYFAIAVGIHNYAPWSGVAVDLGAGETLQAVHKEFYAGGPRSSPTVKDASATSKAGTHVAITFEQEPEKDRTYIATVTLA